MQTWKSCDTLEHLVLIEEFDLLGDKCMLLVAMSKCTDLLTVHPVEEASFATVPPGVDVAIVSEGDGMILSERHIDDLQVLLSEIVDQFG